MFHEVRFLILTAMTFWLGSVVHFDESAFHKGIAIPEFGKIATVDSDVEIPAGTIFKVRFDVAEKARPDTINRTFDSAARFINLHVEAGVPRENIQLAIVVHGGAATDVTRGQFFIENEGRENKSAAAIETLLKNNVQFYVCGQTAAFYDIKKENLLPGVKMAPSAMTMHALLSQQGFTFNPF